MPKSKIIFIVLSVILLAILIIHISEYTFLCDDAFISFRYAKNFASGDGLVFNPGEKVEGYTNFLWVMILSLFSMIGIAPEQMAPILSIAFSIGLLAIFIHFNRRWFSSGINDYFIYIAPLFLALNRTYAVWTTGGLETALFSILVFAAIALLVESSKDSRNLRRSAVLFSLAALTRPEGILLFGSFFGYYFLTRFKDRQITKLIIKSSLIFAAIIAGHFAFRFFYYGYLLPNTFYAKVSEPWFDIGLLYLLLFIHEYGLYLLIIPAIFVLSRKYDSDRKKILLLLTIPFIPYIIYLAGIGGDHFEFRPLMILIPSLALVIQEGIRGFNVGIAPGRIKLAGVLTSGLLIIILFFWTVPSFLSHLNFPDRYDSGIKVQTAKPGTIGSKIPIYSLYLRAFDSIHNEIAGSFVGLRQEEHKMAMEQVFYPQAMMMKEMVDKKYILPDEYISLWCVGTIPYYSGLPTIDFLGLTDAHIAHLNMPQLPGLPRKTARLMAHEKRADWNYLRDRKVVYISIRPAMFFFPQEQYLTDNRLDPSKIPDGTFLVPLADGQFFAFRSTFIPEYFAMTLNLRGLDYYAKTVDKQLIYSPAGSK